MHETKNEASSTTTNTVSSTLALKSNLLAGSGDAAAEAAAPNSKIMTNNSELKDDKTTTEQGDKEVAVNIATDKDGDVTMTEATNTTKNINLNNNPPSSNNNANAKDNNNNNNNNNTATTTNNMTPTTANGTANTSTTTATASTTTTPPASSNTTAAAAAAPSTSSNTNTTNTNTNASNNPPPPVMRGTLSYNEEKRQHVMRGMWNYENSNMFPPQRFELLRNLRPDEELETLPQDGEFHGSFSLAYLHTTSKGKQKERAKVVQESGVKIKFVKVSADEYTMTGKGTNQFGIFHINGNAKPSDHEGDPAWHVEFRKRYEPSAPPPAASSLSSSAKRPESALGTAANGADAGGPLPDPSPSYDSGVVCLRGKIVKQTSADLGSTEMVHRITGYWSSGLNFILADPENTRGLLSKFEYEHKSMVPSAAFPVSGKYSGWFDLMAEDGNRMRINESNVTLKFRKNNAGHFNVDGKGSNVYGKYSITGTLNNDDVITIFRHFQPRKIKASKSVTPPPPPINSATQAPRRASSAAIIENPQLKLEDAKIPEQPNSGDKQAALLEPIPQPANATYSAVSRGVLRVNDDGSHSCSGKWAVTREHFTSGQTSPFTVRLDSLYAKEAAAHNDRQFPLDSAMYKGSFQLKKTAGRYQTIVDQQVVMRFRMNSAGSYNVYGKGVNAIGVFNISGTLIMNGKNGGHIEIYRMYPPELLTPPPAPAGGKTADAASVASAVSTVTAASKTAKPNLPGPPPTAIQRRESTRTVKLPSRLEDDDPTAQLARIMDRCQQILRIMREKDVEAGAFFSDPVDPVALGIPTYHQIIKEPMDLRTIARKMDGNEIDNPEEFSRLMRLVFENAMRFNVDPAHSVHQAARNLLIQFNQRFRDVERMLQTFRRAQGDDKKETKKKKKEPVKPKTVREIRLEEAQALATESAEAMSNLVAAAPTNSANVSRAEFSLLLRMIQQMQNQMVKTHRLLALLSPDEVEVQPTSVPEVALSTVPAVAATAPAPAPRPAPTPAPEPKKKAAPKRKAEVLEEPIVTPDLPLTREEQELLTETINDLPAEHLGGVIQIIREAAPVGADEDEIDLDIDQLSPSTQRKLLRHVSKFVKKPKNKTKKPKTSAADRKKGGSRKATPVNTPAPAPARPPAPAPAPPAPAPPKPASTSGLFGLDDKDDSDSDSDDDKNAAPAAAAPATAKTNQARPGQPAGGKEFKLSSGLGALAGGDDDDDDDDEDEDGEIGFNTSRWSFSKPENSSKSKAPALDDDAWAAARKSAEETKAFENQRKAREAKMKAEAEEAKKQRLKDAAQRGEEIRAQRQEEEAREAALREQKEKEAEEARQAAREAARAQVNAVEQTVDLDAQRDIMAQYEQSFLDKDMGSASPSSDFGF